MNACSLRRPHKISKSPRIALRLRCSASSSPPSALRMYVKRAMVSFSAMFWLRLLRLIGLGGDQPQMGLGCRGLVLAQSFHEPGALVPTEGLAPSERLHYLRFNTGQLQQRSLLVHPERVNMLTAAGTTVSV